MQAFSRVMLRWSVLAELFELTFTADNHVAQLVRPFHEQPGEQISNIDERGFLRLTLKLCRLQQASHLRACSVVHPLRAR
jgi:hypothetical protein